MIIYFVFIFIAGFVDSIVGGGGLITVPLLSIYLGSDIAAIATNKILAVTTSLSAFIVYFSRSKIRWNTMIVFMSFLLLGSYLGTLVSPFFPQGFVKILITLISPGILYVVFHKNYWEKLPKKTTQQKHFFVQIVSGFGCGFYDGAFGPGSGILIFIAFFLVLEFDILNSMAMSKLSCFTTSLIGLASYQRQGLVRWETGLIFIIPLIVGTVTGASVAKKNPDTWVKPMLAVIVVCILIKLWAY